MKNYKGWDPITFSNDFYYAPNIIQSPVMGKFGAYGNLSGSAVANFDYSSNSTTDEFLIGGWQNRPDLAPLSDIHFPTIIQDNVTHEYYPAHIRVSGQDSDLLGLGWQPLSVGTTPSHVFVELVFQGLTPSPVIHKPTVYLDGILWTARLSEFREWWSEVPLSVGTGYGDVPWNRETKPKAQQIGGPGWLPPRIRKPVLEVQGVIELSGNELRSQDFLRYWKLGTFPSPHGFSSNWSATGYQFFLVSARFFSSYATGGNYFYYDMIPIWVDKDLNFGIFPQGLGKSFNPTDVETCLIYLDPIFIPLMEVLA